MVPIVYRSTGFTDTLSPPAVWVNQTRLRRSRSLSLEARRSNRPRRGEAEWMNVLRVVPIELDGRTLSAN
jgi:hypothetical protein